MNFGKWIEKVKLGIYLETGGRTFAKSFDTKTIEWRDIDGRRVYSFRLDKDKLGVLAYPGSHEFSILSTLPITTFIMLPLESKEIKASPEYISESVSKYISVYKEMLSFLDKYDTESICLNEDNKFELIRTQFLECIREAYLSIEALRINIENHSLKSEQESLIFETLSSLLKEAETDTLILNSVNDQLTISFQSQRFD